jgi:hypothetical protein
MALILLAILLTPIILALVLGLYSWSRPEPIRVRVDERINPNRPR